MADDVKIKVGAEAAQFHRVMTGVGERVKSIVGLAEGLKGALAGALGGFSIVAIVGHMAEFAKTIEDASNRLGVTIDEAYGLKKAAREAGVEFDKWFNVQTGMDKFLAEVANRTNFSSSSIGAKFGLKGNERWNDALMKMLQGGATQAELQKIGLGRNANWLVGNRQTNIEHLQGANGVDAEAIHQMARFKLELELLTDEIEKGIIPAIVHWGLALYEGARRAMDAAANWNEASNQARKQLGGLAQTILHPIENRKLTLQFMKQLEAETRLEYEGRTMARNKRIAAFEKDQAEIKSATVERGLPVNLGHEVPGTSNPFLKIGGLIGTDINYRMLRLNEQMLEALLKIESNTGIRSEEPTAPNNPLFMQ